MRLLDFQLELGRREGTDSRAGGRGLFPVLFVRVECPEIGSWRGRVGREGGEADPNLSRPFWPCQNYPA